MTGEYERTGTLENIEKPECPKILKIQKENYNNMAGNLSDCPICKGKTQVMDIVYYDDVGYWNTIVRRCSCYQKYLNSKLIKASGLEAVLEKYTFDNYKTTENWQKIIKESAMTYSDGWFFIGGQSGSGKSFICTAITGKFLQEGISTIYMPWGTEARKLKSIINEPEYDDMIEKFKKPKVLYIDDLWKVKSVNGVPNPQSVTDSDVRIAFDILNYRYANNLKTIISTEFLLPEISEIDTAIGGRIVEMTKDNRQWFNIGRDKSKNWRLK